ncbi:hypothetical protein B0A78_06395 [Flavobacterium columnare NBRC 100251 = ATCC 23463]|uniref:Type VI secretion system contractile sheath small subunit n=3 Tax=Flavobacterium TaxID=237 RepID=G8XBH7_FLACA|nr:MULTISPECIES: hypothetical protein [Flavobacterium]AEW86757.1 hypothetical protein FCOL_09740 [Flavobacterium columnare ATCC 49512]AMO20638.2 hypothetical protein UN65_10095 [Flavobacterium columnare]ANO47168.1 hypothetical protein Pf1_01711 [Flavobacterium columnare]MBF6652451.1 hypothetical protein [Flavobacterium columnare]MBF6654872.1 hypothetical protein [Flavobacterium columnare]
MLSNHGIGGNEVPLDANEAISEIPQNRTIIAQKLTAESPVKPELVEGLTTIEKVFDHFKPEIKVDFENLDGSTKMENLNFKNLGDFGVKGITQQSNFLTGLETEKDQYQKIIKQLKSNKILKGALEDPDAKKALLDSLQSLIKELEENK